MKTDLYIEDTAGQRRYDAVLRKVIEQQVLIERKAAAWDDAVRECPQLGVAARDWIRDRNAVVRG